MKTKPEETGDNARSLRIVSKKLTEVHPYENNPRIIDAAVPQVVESINQCGYITPIVVDEDGIILAGHTRFKALEEMGVEMCDVVVVSGLSEEQKKKYRLLDNKTGEVATWDAMKLREELKDVDFMGFDFGQPKIDSAVFNDAEIDMADLEEHEKIYCPRCHAEVPV